MKNWRAIILLIPVGAAGLAGCGSVEGEAAGGASTSVAAEPAAFHFESGDLALGEFDPHAIGDGLFDPCAEISDEEFAAAGFSGKHSLGYDAVTQRSGCYFESADDRVMVGFVSTAANKDVAMQQAEVVTDANLGTVPGIYVVIPRQGGGDCYAIVDTVRGALAAAASSVDVNEDSAHLCAEARHGLEALYSLGK
ncbi:DUF3558 family protein [Corynebacterium senegalense]|uniref:DUF3558 family protein n=1 Tax=Corynebacterium senegalense TaxID=2080750 RepID=UPI000E205D53|nr:DUF3558 family protein [Corynebacterium senegalense]